MKKTGKAYGFFYCNRSKEVVEEVLPRLCDKTQRDSGLELTLIEGLDNVDGDPELRDLAQDAKDQGINYVLKATKPNATNRETAKEVEKTFRRVYQSHLYDVINREPFRGNVFYEENGEYISTVKS